MNKTPPTKLGADRLEDRTVPTTFGIPWPNAQGLTLSFAPDGTAGLPQPSNLFAGLNAAAPTADWQREVLRAFQTWAAETNVNIGVVPEYGHAFGSPGRTAGDPRFGDIRVGGYPQGASTLAVNTPYDPYVANTRAGDVLVNTGAGVGVAGRPGADLYTVVLNEAGNVLGLADSADRASALHGTYVGPKAGLTAADRTAVKALYGGDRRPDRYEGKDGNSTLDRATEVKTPGGYDRSRPVTLTADLTTPADADVFKIKTLKGNGVSNGVTVRLRTEGVSLLVGRVSVLDAAGTLVGTAARGGPLGADPVVFLPAPAPDATYYIRVEAAAGDVFGVGGYQLQIDYRSRDGQGDGALQSLSERAGGAILTPIRQAWLGNDLGTDNSFGDARTLAWDPAYGPQQVYQVAGSVLAAGDKDVYKFKTAKAGADERNHLRVTLTPLGGAGFVPRVVVYDDAKAAVPAQVTAGPDGRVVVDVPNPKQDKDYFLEVTAAPGGGATGDYLAAAQFHEVAHNETPGTADPLATTPGFADKTHYERIAHLADGRDADTYKLRSAKVPDGTPNVMTVSVLALGTQRVDPVVTVLDEKGVAVPATILRNSPGAYTIQVPNVLSDKDYFVRVAAARPAGGFAAGDYSLVVDFGQRVVTETTLAAGRVGGGAAPAGGTLTVKENQFLHFSLAPTGAGPGVAVRAVVLDAAGKVVFDLTAVAGEVRTGDVFLTAGTYTVRFAAVTRDGSPAPAVDFTFRGSVGTDPIGPALDDPTGGGGTGPAFDWAVGPVAWNGALGMYDDPWLGM